MTIVWTRQQFKDLYPYKSPPNPAPCPGPGGYPKRYPCVVWVTTEGGGIMGDYEEVHIVYPPEGMRGAELRAFLRGMRAREE